MNVIDEKFHDEIELERLWMSVSDSKTSVFSMSPFTLLIVFGLWEKSPHGQLIVWFVLFNLFNLVKWRVFTITRLRKKEFLAKNLAQFRIIILMLGIFTGLAWGVCIMLFLNPDDPANALIISIPAIIQSVGAMVTWFASLATILMISITPSLALMFVCIMHGGIDYLITGMIFATLPVLSLLYGKNLQKAVNRSLFLSFENAALRRDSEEKSLLLETALENMAQGISMTDADDCLRMWNRQFVNLLGTAGQNVSTDAYLSAILSSAKPPLNVEADGKTKYRLPDGQVYVVRQTTLTQGGRLLTYTDVTDLYNREQALEKASKEAVQANAAKTRFLAAASHDLRQPIHALGLFFAELSDRVHSPETALVIGQIDDSISAINSMLNALLDISKLDAGVVKPNLEDCNLKDIFNRLKTDFQPIALENQNELRIRSSSAIVSTDPVMLERMLRNLIGNALRYTENGRVLVAARQRKQHIEIQIIDNGVGIPKDQLDDIFIEFHQLQNPARDRRRGLGLGLAIVKRLAKLLDHKIKVVSQFSRGSCFSIILPLANQQTTKQPIHQVDTAYVHNYSLEGRQILVLDDDISVLEGMHGLLSHWGCQVISAGSPSEAVDKVAASILKPEVLIIDYRLTDNVSGIDVATNLQKRFGYPIAVLIITGDTGPERLREADASGFPLLHKPVQPAKLRSTLHYLISKGNPDKNE